MEAGLIKRVLEATRFAHSLITYPLLTKGRDVNELEEKAFEVLLNELSDVRAKSRSVDEWIFKSLSIAYIPFLGLLIVPYLNPQYRIAFLAAPFLSGVGLLVHSIFLNHYIFCGTYTRHLERRLNEILETEEIIESKYVDIFYHSKTSIPFLATSLAFAIVLLVNVILVPVINSIASGILYQQPDIPALVAFGFRHFWLLHIAFLGSIVATLGFGHLVSLRKLKRLVGVEQHS
jgi:hypothetical protein